MTRYGIVDDRGIVGGAGFRSVKEAVDCLSGAEEYVVAEGENGSVRPLTPEEETEYQSARTQAFSLARKSA